MTQAEQDVYNEIKRIAAMKLENNIVPSFALRVEVIKNMTMYARSEISIALHGLTKNKVIRYGNTINDFYFVIND